MSLQVPTQLVSLRTGTFTPQGRGCSLPPCCIQPLGRQKVQPRQDTVGGPGCGVPGSPRFLPRQAGLLPTPFGSPGGREGGTESPSVRLSPGAQKVGGGKTKPPQMKLSQRFKCDSSHRRSPVVFRRAERVWGDWPHPASRVWWAGLGSVPPRRPQVLAGGDRGRQGSRRSAARNRLPGFVQQKRRDAPLSARER